MYKVPDKDIIKSEMLPHLSILRKLEETVKRAFKPKSCLSEAIKFLIQGKSFSTKN